MSATELSPSSVLPVGSTSNSPAKEGIDVQVERSFSNITQPVWDEAVARLGGPVYMTFDWLKTWWDFYGGAMDLRLFVFRARNQITGLIPISIEQFGGGPFKVRVARLVGANIPPKTFNPPIEPVFASEIFVHLFQHLMGNDACDLLSLGPVSEAWPGQASFKNSCEASPEVARVSYLEHGVQTIFRLPPTFEEYLAGLSGNERKSRMKRLRHLEKNYSISFDSLESPLNVQDEFLSFVQQHSMQWRAVKKGGHFEAWPEALEFNRALVRSQAERGRVRFFRMLADQTVVANRYTFLFQGRLFSELPARSVGEPWDKLGIGAISLLKFNQQLIEAGIREVDSGLGGYEHKTQLGGESFRVGLWRVLSQARGSRLKTRCFLAFCGLVQALYRKVWYRRIVPRLPERFGRSQSRFWLRFDL